LIGTEKKNKQNNFEDIVSKGVELEKTMESLNNDFASFEKN
jgi:hypothetical protein